MYKNQKILLKERVKKYIADKELTSNNERILIGVSGGSDSISLLHILADIFQKNNLCVAYINHGLRPKEAKKEQEFVKKICLEYKIVYDTSHVDTQGFAKKTGRSIEDAARILRYQQFSIIAQKNSCSKIAVGHNADDQVEHFFVRLFRGGSLKSLSGMLPLIKLTQYPNNTEKKKKDISYTQPLSLIRPLLFLHKKELQKYLNECGFLWCEDSSNRDSKFVRNRIRGELLPEVRRRFSPAIDNQILQVMDIIKYENNYLEHSAKEAYDRITKIYLNNFIALDCVQFLNEHPALQRRIIEQCFWEINTTPNFTHISQIISLIKDGKNGQELHLAEGLRVFYEYSKVIFCYPLKDKNYRRPIRQNNTYEVQLLKKDLEADKTIKNSSFFLSFTLKVDILPYNNRLYRDKTNNSSTLYVDYDAISFPIFVRPMKNGDSFNPCNTNITKKIGRFFSECRIPAPQRTLWPLFIANGEIMAVAGLQIANFCKITTTTKRVLRIKYIAETMKP